MLRSFMQLVLVTFLVSTLSGCIVFDEHHNHGNGKIPPGQLKKMK